ncbi:MAG: hypothetical protein WC121_10780 [Candidatus Kapaibacterium sp.]
MSEEQTNYDNLQASLEQLEEEIEIPIRKPNGDIVNVYYQFKNLNYRQIESTKICMLVWDEKLRNLPTTIATLQQALFEEADVRGMAMILYTKDAKGNPEPFTGGDIKKHRPYELLNYTNGDQYDTLTMCRNFFLSKWGVTSFDFKGQFLDTVKLLMTHQMENIQEMMVKAIASKGYSKKQQKDITELIQSLLTQSLVNTSQVDSSGQSVPDSDTKEKKSTQ